MKHTEIKVGKTYFHRFEGKEWHVKVVDVFEDRHRWGWEGRLVGQQNGIEDGSPCWGWCDELKKRARVGDMVRQ